jgi:hypothetical protein
MSGEAVANNEVTGMTIEDPDKVDLLGRHKQTGSPTLTISDHMPWGEWSDHFRLIERKLGSYLNFIKSGQIWEHIPGDRHVPITIDLIWKFPPTPLAEKFLSAAREQLWQEEGIVFTYHGLEKNEFK